MAEVMHDGERGGGVASSVHESGNAKDSLQNVRAVKVCLAGRNTGMGAYTEWALYSTRQRKRLKPHRTEYSRTGNHWWHYFFLLPGKYLAAVKDISNSGKHYCRYCLIRVFTQEEFREMHKNDERVMQNFDHYYRHNAYEIIDLPTKQPPAEYVEVPCECLEEKAEW